MKNLFLKVFCRLFVLSALISCDDLVSIAPDRSTPIDENKGGLYILCDGNYSLNNSTLALYNFNNNTQNTDYFQIKNGRKLGDTGNDMQRYGSKIYLVVNASSQIEVLNARTGKSIKQIPLFNGATARQPRYITFWEDKAYVCSFDGTVARIDTASLEVETYVSVGRNPDGVAASNGKLYVSNSGGLDYSNELGYDRTVSVVDLSGFTVTKNITVGINPGKIKADIYGYVYVLSRGDYASVAGVWQRIDTRTDQVVATYNIPVTNFDFYGNLAYLYSYDNTSKESWIKVFDLRSGQMVQESFIKDGTVIKTPYGINVNPDNGDVYITDAGNYISQGDVFCFSQDGFLKYKITNVGISPNTVLYVEDLEDAASEEEPEVQDAKYLYRVLDYTPAPGQFIGTYPTYSADQTAEEMRVKVENMLKGEPGGMVSLGRFGGSLTFAFKTAVQNVAASNDFRIFGNAFLNSAEPGIVQVSVDVNGNGQADDEWYELAGSEYSKSSTLKNYRICYYRPTILSDSVFYRDNHGRAGFVNACYPAWKGDSIVCTGTLLAPTAIQNATGYWVLNNLDWGYADNQSNRSELSCFDIDWAVNAAGQSVHLGSVDFIRIYTGVNQNAGMIGELSTEITGAENLHP
ncbi:MAG: YncE family protein [Bacteroidales bacterium]|nr:YncE family protein [Bacteroidales bacterium]